MKAIVLNGSMEVKCIEVDKPKCGKDQVLIKVHASSLNHRELWISKGMYPGMKVPCILGADGAGDTDDIGLLGRISDYGDASIIICRAI